MDRQSITWLFGKTFLLLLFGAIIIPEDVNADESALIASESLLIQSDEDNSTDAPLPLDAPVPLEAPVPSSRLAMLIQQESEQPTPAPLLNESDASGLSSDLSGDSSSDPIGTAAGDASGSATGDSPASPIESFGEAPIDRTPQFLRSVTPLLKPGQMQFDWGAVYSVQETNFPVLVGGGSILARGDVVRRSLFVPLAMRYGLNERTQLFINAPVGWYDTQFATVAGDSSDSEGGIGDTTFGFTRLLSQNNRAGRSLVGTVSATAPTGNPLNPLVFNGGGTGNGVWRLGGDLLVIQNLDPVILFYGGGYAYNFENEFSGFDVELGHQISYRMGLGFAANERVTLSGAFQGLFVTETKVDDVHIPNTEQDLMQLRFAATIAKCNKLTEPFVAFGLTDSSPSATVGVVFTK